MNVQDLIAVLETLPRDMVVGYRSSNGAPTYVEGVYISTTYAANLNVETPGFDPAIQQVTFVLLTTPEDV